MEAKEVAAGSRKRGAVTAFFDDPFGFHELLPPPPLAKRGRWSPSVADLGVSMEFDPVDPLQVVFPGADPKNYSETSENVLDAAINSFKAHLLGSDAVSSQDASDAPSDANTPTNSSEWADVIVKEMTSALNLIDAKNRAFQILELFKKSTIECSSNSDATQKMHEEHKILKLMLGGLLQQNCILKRAFMIQHNRLNHHDNVQFKDAVCKYQEQIKSLEDRNYALSFHLEQSKQRGR